MMETLTMMITFSAKLEKSRAGAGLTSQKLSHVIILIAAVAHNDGGTLNGYNR
jgi:hypothetical protein